MRLLVKALFTARRAAPVQLPAKVLHQQFRVAEYLAGADYRWHDRPAR